MELTFTDLLPRPFCSPQTPRVPSKALILLRDMTYPPTSDPRSVCIAPLGWLPTPIGDTGFRIPYLDPALAALILESDGSLIHVVGSSISYTISASSVAKPDIGGRVPPCQIVSISYSPRYILFVCFIESSLCMVTLSPQSPPQQFSIYDRNDLDTSDPLYDFTPSISVVNLPHILLADPQTCKIFILLGSTMKPVGVQSLDATLAPLTQTSHSPLVSSSSMDVTPTNSVDITNKPDNPAPHTFMDGLFQHANFVRPSAACAAPTVANLQGVRFYIADGYEIKQVTTNSVATMPLTRDSSFDLFPPSWSPNFCSLAINSEGVIFALDNSIGLVVRIHHNVMSILSRGEDTIPGDPSLTSISALISDNTTLLGLGKNGKARLLRFPTPRTLPSASPTQHLTLQKLPSDVWMTIAHFLEGQDLVQLQTSCRSARNVFRRKTRLDIASSKAEVHITDAFGTWVAQAPFLEELTLSLLNANAMLTFNPTHPLRQLSSLHTLILHCRISYIEDANIFKFVPSLTKLEMSHATEVDHPFLHSLPRGLTYFSLPNLDHGFPLHILPPGLTHLNLQKAPLSGLDLALPAGMDPLLPELKSLIVSNCRVADNNLLDLPQAITSLDMSASETLTDYGVALLPRNLTHLNISDAPNITDQSGHSFPIYLTSLNVNYNSMLTNIFVAKLASMSTHQEHLKELRIESSKVNIYAISHIELLASLERLYVPSQFTADLRQELIPRLPPNLLQLDVSSNCILAMPNTFNQLEWRLPRHLTYLRWSVQTEPFTDAHFSYLPPTLLVLNLKNCDNISPEGLARLKTLTPHLRELKLNSAVNLKPSILRRLPPTLTRLELPKSLMNALRNHNTYPLSHLNLVQLELASTPCLYDSSLFFVLPHTLTHLSIPYLQWAVPSHLKYLPIGLEYLSLPSVANIDDTNFPLQCRQLHTLELNSCSKLSPLTVAKLPNLQFLKLGLHWDLLEQVQSAHGLLHPLDSLRRLPPKLTSLDLPNLRAPVTAAFDINSFSTLPNLRYLSVGGKSSFKFEPRELLSNHPTSSR